MILFQCTSPLNISAPGVPFVCNVREYMCRTFLQDFTDDESGHVYRMQRSSASVGSRYWLNVPSRGSRPAYRHARLASVHNASDPLQQPYFSHWRARCLWIPVDGAINPLRKKQEYRSKLHFLPQCLLYDRIAPERFGHLDSRCARSGSRDSQSLGALDIRRLP